MNKKGFTLVELLVTIAIIGILSSVAVVNLNSARKKAQQAAGRQMMFALLSAATVCSDAGEILQPAPIPWETDVDVCTGMSPMPSGWPEPPPGFTWGTTVDDDDSDGKFEYKMIADISLEELTSIICDEAGCRLNP